MEDQKYTDKQFHKTNTLWPFLKRLFGLAKKNYPKYFWSLIVSVGIVSIADGYFPMLWRSFIDELIVPTFEAAAANPSASWKELLPWNMAWEIGAQYIVWMLVMAAGVLVFIWCAEQIKERIIFDLRTTMFERLQQLSFSFYDKNSTGWLVSRITSDADRVTELISWGFVSVVWGITMIFIAFGFMFSIDAKLTSIVLATLPLLFFVSVKIRLLVLKYSRSSRKQNSEMIAYVTEHINGVEVNKATVQEETSINTYAEKATKMKHYAFKSSYYTAMYMPLVFLTGSIAAAMVLFYGGHLHISVGVLSLGSWAAFFGYSRFIFEPIFDISRFYALTQDSLSAGERIFSLIDEKPIIQDHGTKTIAQMAGQLSFKDVSFYYKEDKLILDKFNLHVKAGESIALVGPTGHGKTTITSLIGRFYEPTAGKILVDGLPYQSLELKNYRSHLGVILQEPHLFSGTIRENIVFGMREVGKQMLVSDAAIGNALELLGADGMMEKLDLEVGESGKNLSNGERQIVSFARAIIKDPSILIMDEATSSIDTLSEAKIQKGIAKIIQNRTSFIIAHRLSTIKNCDRIIVIENGGIKEMGSHSDLLQQKGHYYELFMKQKREFAAIV